MRRLAFIGDIGGHAALFERILTDLGCDVSRRTMPRDLVIVQVGDLVSMARRRGEDSNRSFAIADAMVRAHPEQWIQLWGNHEIAALGGPQRSMWTGGDIEAATIERLEGWRRERLAVFAFAFEANDGPWLVTHAGLTFARWVDAGRPNAHDAARILNAGSSDVAGSRAGSLVTGAVDERADVTWAEVVREFYEPWIRSAQRGETVPFHQVHGHGTPWQWASGAFFEEAGPDLRKACRVDSVARRTATTLGMLASGEPAFAVCVDWVLLDMPTQSGVPWPILIREIN
ncbi:MAG: metallophosphoesterase family protein [Vulcanimicrobiaceae bacterium]